MEKKWTRRALPVLCAALLAAAVVQGRTAARLTEQLSALTEQAARQEERIGAIEGADAAQAEPEGPLCQTCQVSVTELDTDRRTLTVSLRLTLSRELEPYALQIAAHRPEAEPGEDQRWPRCWDVERDGKPGAGYAGSLTLPYDENSPVALSLGIREDQEERWEELRAFGSMAGLLPLSGAAGSGEMGYNLAGDGRLYLVHWTATLPEPADAVSFRVTKNGGTALEADAPAGETPGIYSGIGLEGQGVACGPGDRVELHLLCTDRLGFGYDFTLQTWEITKAGKAAERWPASAYPAVTWPE